MEAALGPLETAVTELITEEGIPSVCDFGCGSGHLLESLRHAGEVVDADPDPTRVSARSTRTLRSSRRSSAGSRDSTS